MRKKRATNPKQIFSIFFSSITISIILIENDGCRRILNRKKNIVRFSLWEKITLKFENGQSNSFQRKLSLSASIKLHYLTIQPVLLSIEAKMYAKLKHSVCYWPRYMMHQHFFATFHRKFSLLVFQPNMASKHEQHFKYRQ